MDPALLYPSANNLSLCFLETRSLWNESFCMYGLLEDVTVRAARTAGGGEQGRGSRMVAHEVKKLSEEAGFIAVQIMNQL